MTPIRPTSITAAAVLLIVFGAQLLIPASFLTVVLLLSSLREEVGGCCCGSGIGFLFVTALYLILIGIGLLRGTVLTCASVLGPVVMVGVSLVLTSLLTLMGCVWVFLKEAPDWLEFARFNLEILLGPLVIWANTVGICVAAVLLRRGADDYLIWRSKRLQPREEAGYEPDDD